MATLEALDTKYKKLFPESKIAEIPVEPTISKKGAAFDFSKLDVKYNQLFPGVKPVKVQAPAEEIPEVNQPSFVEKTLREVKLSGLTLRYLPQAIDETLGISKAVKEKELPRAAFDSLYSFGEAIATAPFRFAKGLIGIVSPEMAERFIPETTPHPTELLLKAIGKEEWVKTSRPVTIGLSPQEQTKKNIEAGMNPWLSGAMIGSQVIFDAAITGGIAKGILAGVAKAPKVTSAQVSGAQKTLNIKPRATP